MDSSHTVGNGFTYQGNLSSSKLTSVLEAVAGEYALVINGHSLVRLAISSLEQPVRQGNAHTLLSACPQLLCSLFRDDCGHWLCPLSVWSCSLILLTASLDLRGGGVIISDQRS